jgi:hypothetical protein
LQNIEVSLATRGEEEVTTLCRWIESRKNRPRREKKENRKIIDLQIGMKMDQIQMDITDIVFVFTFLFGFGHG